MKRIFSNIAFTYYYLKGVVRFRNKNYISAHSYFEKAKRFSRSHKNELFYQYFGQTLLAIGAHEKSFKYLSRAFDKYEKLGWFVSDDEELTLATDTLKALKYIEDNFGLKLDKILYEKKIEIRKNLS